MSPKSHGKAVPAGHLTKSQPEVNIAWRAQDSSMEPPEEGLHDHMRTIHRAGLERRCPRIQMEAIWTMDVVIQTMTLRRPQRREILPVNKRANIM